MTSPTPVSVRTFPENPDLRHLKDQARDLVRSGAAQKLSEAQFQLAGEYGFPSWPKLKAHVESVTHVGALKAAIDANDLLTVQRLMTEHPTLHRAPLGYNKNGSLTWVAECRVPRVPPNETRLAMAAWMIENGSDVHQGGDGPLMRAALSDMRIPMMELLVGHGADVTAQWAGFYPIICAPCETLAPRSLKWLINHGANPRQVSTTEGTPLSMVIATYSRDPEGKAACLEVLIEAGIELPDTPMMAFHRGRIDLLESALESDPLLLDRRFSITEIFPPTLGIDPNGGLHVTSCDGVTLLHLAIEYDDLRVARWALEKGANPNARATVDEEGFGGHTPLFHAVVVLGRRDDEKAHLLLDNGADPNARATIRKQLVDMGDPEQEKMREFHDVTPTEYARQFQAADWVSEPALALISAAGGR